MDAYFDDEPGYRIRPDEFGLPDITLERRRGRRHRPGHPGLGARAAGRGHHRGGPQADRARRPARRLRARHRRAPAHRRRAVVRRLLGGHPGAHAGRVRLPPLRADPGRHPAPPAVGRRALLGPLVRRRARHRPGRGAGLPALPRPGRGPARRRARGRTTCRPAPTYAPPPSASRPRPPPSGPSCWSARVPGWRCAATPRRVETGVAGPDDRDRLGPPGRVPLGARPRRRAARLRRRRVRRGARGPARDRDRPPAGRAGRGSGVSAPKPAASAAKDQVARLLTLVPFLHARGQIRLDDAATALGVPADQLVKDLKVLLMCGLPGGYPDDLIDVDLDALEGPEADGVIRVSNADYLARPLRLTADRGHRAHRGAAGPAQRCRRRHPRGRRPRAGQARGGRRRGRRRPPQVDPGDGRRRRRTARAWRPAARRRRPAAGRCG